MGRRGPQNRRVVMASTVLPHQKRGGGRNSFVILENVSTLSKGESERFYSVLRGEGGKRFQIQDFLIMYPHSP